MLAAFGAGCVAHGDDTVLHEGYSADLNGIRVHYRVRLSTRARRERITIDPREGLVVVLPRHVKPQHPPPVLLQHRAWILRKIAEYGGALPCPERGTLMPGNAVPFQGHPITLVFGEEEVGGPRVRLRDAQLHISPAPLSGRHAAMLVREWMRGEARAQAQDALWELAARVGVRYGKLSIRDQRTRWGSCSQSGNIALSWRLIMAPPEILRSVVAHEVAHLVHPRHDAAFWELAEKLHPDILQCRQWLHAHGHQLKL